MKNRGLSKAIENLSNSFKPSVNYTNIVKKFAKTYTTSGLFDNSDLTAFTKVIRKQSEYFRNIQKAIQEAQEKAIKDIPLQIKVLDKMYALGWSAGSANELTLKMINKPKEFLEMSDKNLDELLLENFSEKGSLKSEIYGLSNDIPKYAEVIQVMGDTLDEDTNNWIIMYPQIFALIDRVISYQSNDFSLKNTKFTNKDSIIKFYKKLLKKDNANDLFEYIYLKTIERATYLWQSQPFSEPELKFTRNAVQHGRYDPKNYTYKQFAQLVLMLSTLTMFNN
ncbi:hypothetical protein JMK98_02235 [Pediococcus pentosaceus]|uniref:hypothetical protein n=1 Tax=Pediococcus pentosaceus TaxID=1255 RepID=UPI001966401A|nr:hypothetical protein [Pediococcus pentosaceus]MBM9929300.1 hypothetical protein [Pediococcus pentosaceus]MBY4581328.1 hypothetical protein [Pediococcus pentosaceus]